LPSCVQTIPLEDLEGWKEAIANPITDGLEESVVNHQISNVSACWGDIYDNIIDSRTSTE
jgi:hypothetical protein